MEKTIKAAIYGRVSTADKGQDVGMQLYDLNTYAQARGWTVTKEYIDDGISGVKVNRPAFKTLLSDAKQRKFDIVLVWKLSRFSRSMIHLITSVTELQSVGIDFVSLKDSIDLSTPAGRLQFHLLAALAEFERENIRENVRAGIENARRKGVKLGRKGIAPIEKQKVWKFKVENPAMGIRKIAKKTGLSVGSVHAILKHPPVSE